VLYVENSLTQNQALRITSNTEEREREWEGGREVGRGRVVYLSVGDRFARKIEL